MWLKHHGRVQSSLRLYTIEDSKLNLKLMTTPGCIYAGSTQIHDYGDECTVFLGTVILDFDTFMVFIH